MTTPKFNIEDCSESEQEDTQKKSSENQPLFQTSLFSTITTTNSKQLKKKPLVKLTLQDFLTNYDQNFDDVFGEQEDLPQHKQSNQQTSKKKRKQSSQNKKKRPQSDSESEFKSKSKKTKNKQILDSEYSNEKQIEDTLFKESNLKNQNNKKHRLTKINSSKFTSEEKSNDIKRYDPNSVDLPENTKTDKKNYKLRKFLFNFGLEQQNPGEEQEQQQEEEEEKEEQIEEQKESVKELKSKNITKKTNQNNINNQIEQLDIDQIENKRKKKPQIKSKKQNEDEKQQNQLKQPEIDQKTMLNLDTLNINVHIPECIPKDNQNQQEEHDNINQ